MTHIPFFSTISLALLALAFVFMIIAALRVPSPVHFGWLGMATWCMSVIVRHTPFN